MLSVSSEPLSLTGLIVSKIIIARNAKKYKFWKIAPKLRSSSVLLKN